MNAFVVRTADAPGQPRQVSFLPNTNGGQLACSADGTTLFLTTGQRTETVQVARIDLVPRTPRFREDQFRDLFDVTRRRTPHAGAARQQRPACQRAAHQRTDSVLLARGRHAATLTR